ncbi:hypothetical protein ACJ7V3_11955 [Halomonas elongata]|uniref:hypothetical protein n=1 Tax=Halomonas elongata TaxID=2746 RepID=UPI0038D3CA10
MADPTNYQQFNQRTTELVQVVTDALKAAYGLENISQGEALGLLAGIDDLASAPVGNASAVLAALGIDNTWNTSGAKTWPNDRLSDPTGVTTDIYYIDGNYPDRPLASFGHLLHIAARFGRHYQLFMNGFNGRGTAQLFFRMLNSDTDGNWPDTDWGTLYHWNATTGAANGDWAVAKSISKVAAPDNVGSYIFAVTDTPCWHGQTTAGANLVPCGIQPNGAIAPGDNGKSRTGTWRCLGRGAAGDATLWIKVAD